MNTKQKYWFQGQLGDVYYGMAKAESSFQAWDILFNGIPRCPEDGTKFNIVETDSHGDESAFIHVVNDFAELTAVVRKCKSEGIGIIE